MALLKRAVEIDIRKNGSNENIVSVVCDLYDMSCYVDMLLHIVIDNIGDYILITPLRDLKLFPDEIF